MFVSRSDVSLRSLIHCESWVTDANAMSASLDGSGPGSPCDRANASRGGPIFAPPRFGFHCVAGASSGSSAILRGPSRRSRSGAIDCRQLATACSRCAALIVTRASFSASANVDAETAGPAVGDVPKVGGAPGVDGGVDVDCGASPLRHARPRPSSPIGARTRNWRRVFTAWSPVDNPSGRSPGREAGTCAAEGRVA